MTIHITYWMYTSLNIYVCMHRHNLYIYTICISHPSKNITLLHVPRFTCEETEVKLTCLRSYSLEIVWTGVKPRTISLQTVLYSQELKHSMKSQKLTSTAPPCWCHGLIKTYMVLRQFWHSCSYPSAYVLTFLRSIKYKQ